MKKKPVGGRKFWKAGGNNLFADYLRVAPFSHALWRTLEARALEKVKINGPVLDIGCGFGEFAGVCFQGKVEMGVDINEKDLFLAAQKKKYRRLLFADARNLPFADNSFRTVISISTLEHIEGVETVFRESYRVLRRGGRLIYTVPTKTANRYLVCPGLFHLVFKHRSVLSERQWQELAVKAGFKIRRSEGLLSARQLTFYQLGLAAAFLTQINRWLWGRRMLFSPSWRSRWLSKALGWLVFDRQVTGANLLVVAEKD